MVDSRFETVNDKVSRRLTDQYQEDIKKVLKTVEGRRVFSYLLMSCGLMDATMRGNSKDFHAAGRRSVAIDLIGSVDALGLDGMDLRHTAEKEYVLFQKAIITDIEKAEGR